MWAFCAAAVSFVLVEATAGVEYVGAGLQHSLTTVLAWMPELSLLPLQLAVQSMGNWGTWEFLLSALPLVLVSLLLVVGTTISRQSRQLQRQRARH